MRLRHFSAGLWLLLGLVVGCRSNGSKVGQNDWNQRIRYYQKVLAESPQRYPVRVQLAEAYLEQARNTHDPIPLREARRELEASLKIQPTFEAFLTMAKVQNYSHRFTNALDWAQRAAVASPEGKDTPEILGLRLEAHLGLGQLQQAEDLLAHTSANQAPFYWAASRSACLKSQGRWTEAALAMRQATEEARTLGSQALALWGEINIAGCYLDGGQAAAALPYLETASKQSPHHRLLRIHWAEYHEAMGSPAQAYAIYQSLLRETEDPELHQRSFLLARQLGRDRSAQLHFQAAEAAYQKALEAGEIYTLGALARLYTSAHVNLHQARDLAQRNLQYCQDPEALKTWERLDSMKKSKEP